MSRPAAAKEEPKPYFSGAVAGLSQYIFRGYELSKDSVVIQPSLTVGYRGFEATLWGNLDTNDKYTKADKANWNETDLTLSYTYDFGPVKASGGYIYYAFEGVDDSQELFLKIGREFSAFPHPGDLSGNRQLPRYVSKSGDQSFLQPDQGNHPGPGGLHRLPDFRYRQNCKIQFRPAADHR